MCANARNGNSSQRQIEMVLASQGIDSFARNYALTSILLSLILFVFGLIVYISFRLRAFGWLEAPVSIADMLPGAFSPERLADADFDPSRQRKLLPYRSVYRSGHFAQNPSLSEGISNFFQALFGVFSSWLLLCVRIPPEKERVLLSCIVSPVMNRPPWLVRRRVDLSHNQSPALKQSAQNPVKN